MHVKVLFFGLLKDLAGRPEVQAEFPEGTTVGDIAAHFSAAIPGFQPVLPSVLLARNQEFAAAGTVVVDGDEVAFLPPVSGGAGGYTHEISDAGGNYFALTRDPVDVRAVAARLLAGEDGAVVTFEGVVRNNTKGRATRYLEYECYESMAIKLMARIGAEIASAQAISRIAMVHRLGRMEIGETSVAIIACAPHRRPAFEAALEGINRLKKTVPIWKKEYFVDGEVWVEGEWDESLQSH